LRSLRVHATRCSLEQNDNNRWVKSLALFSAIVVTPFAYTGAGGLVGYFLWKKAGLPVWIVAVPSVLGLILAFYRVYQISKKEWND
jgi:hypothetical protein